MRISWVQPQGFQCFRASTQQERHPVHIEKIHPTKSESPKQADHVLQKAHPPETRQPQPSSERRGEERKERQVVSRSPPRAVLIVDEIEVLQVLKKSDEIYDLPAGPAGVCQAELSDRW